MWHVVRDRLGIMSQQVFPLETISRVRHVVSVYVVQRLEVVCSYRVYHRWVHIGANRVGCITQGTLDGKKEGTRGSSVVDVP